MSEPPAVAGGFLTASTAFRSRLNLYHAGNGVARLKRTAHISNLSFALFGAKILSPSGHCRQAAGGPTTNNEPIKFSKISSQLLAFG